MFSRLTHKGKLGIICTAAALAVCAVVFLCLADVLMPEATGEKVQKDGKLIVFRRIDSDAPSIRIRTWALVLA